MVKNKGNHFFVLAVSLLLGSFSFAQSLLVPFKFNEKYGLLDERNEIVLQAQFDNLQWLIDKYFIATHSEFRSEMKENFIQNSLKPNQKIELKSLYYQKQALITSNLYSTFRVVPEILIIAFFQGNPKNIARTQEEFDKIKEKTYYFTLFDEQGNRIGEEFYKHLELIALSGKSKRNKNKEKLALCFVQKFDGKFDLFVYDSDARKIKNYLFQNVTQFKILDKNFESGSYFVNYLDQQNSLQKKEIKINSNGFEFIDFLEEIEGFRLDREFLHEKQKETPIQVAETNFQVEESRFRAYYEQEKGVLYYVKSLNEKQEVKINKEAQVFFQRTNTTKQLESLIYKQNNQFGWIQNGEISKIQFDSLAYFGNQHFLACENKQNSLKCGVLDLNGKIQIPIEYDEVLGFPKQFEFYKDDKSQRVKLQAQRVRIQINNYSDYYLPMGPTVFAYKNGKAGAFKPNGTLAIPFEYDEIAKNGVELKNEMENQYFVLKKNEEYGLILSAFDSESKQSIQETIEPIFPYYPAYYLENYYGIKGFRLFALYNEEGQFVTFANEFSWIYKK